MVVVVILLKIENTLQFPLTWPVNALLRMTSSQLLIRAAVLSQLVAFRL